MAFLTNPSTALRSGSEGIYIAGAGEKRVITSTSRCANDNWFVSIYFEGRGGNGIYDYYWDGELIAAQQTNSFTVEISSPGGSIIANAEVFSGDGQTLAKELFIGAPNCFGG